MTSDRFCLLTVGVHGKMKELRKVGMTFMLSRNNLIYEVHDNTTNNINTNYSNDKNSKKLPSKALEL